MTAATSLYTRLVAGALFPLQERLKRHDTVAVRRGLEDSQWIGLRTGPYHASDD